MFKREKEKDLFDPDDSQWWLVFLVYQERFKTWVIAYKGKKKINEFDYNKIQESSRMMDTRNKGDRMTKWEKLSALYTTNKELICRIYKEHGKISLGKK